MNTKQKQNTENGYILLYVILAITLFVALASGVVKSTVEEVELGAQELSAVRALAAADAALECFSYWARQPNFPFNTNTPQQTINCNTNAGSIDFDTPNGSGFCTQQTSPPYSYMALTELPALDNGSCADVYVEVIPRYVDGLYDRPGNTPLCALRIKAVGYDDCTSKAVSRTRWETIGGWDMDSSGVIGETMLGGGASLPATTTLDDGTNIIEVAVDSFAVLHIEKSGVAGTTHESNSIRINVEKTSAPLIIGEVIGYEVRNNSSLGAYASDLKVAFDDGAGTKPLFSEFTASKTSTTLQVSLPGDTPTGFYPIVVRAFYGGGVYDETLVFIDVFPSNRGQE